MKEKHPVLTETLVLLAGEVAVCAVTILVFYLIGKLTPAVIFGALLGTFVMIVNFAALALITDAAFREAVAERGNGEMDEEEAKKFAEEHQMRLRAKLQISTVVRSLSMLALLVVAFLFQNIFNPIATIVPLLLYRPLLSVAGLICGGKKANP